MKKGTIIVGVICLVVGFLGGYIYQAQTSFREAQRQAAGAPHAHEEAASGGAETSAPGGGMGQRLPEGHPPIDISAVVKTLEEQAAQNPRDPEPRLKLANYLYDQQQWQRAIEWYQKGLELDPKNVNARTDMGTAYFNLGRPADALREYRQSLEIDPTHQPTMFNLIVVHLDGRHDVAAAQQAWDRLHKRNPSYPGLDSLKGLLDSARASGTPVRQ
ncbi:MAG: tetratricopeptide repeat protein [Terriglobia bacterium]